MKKVGIIFLFSVLASSAFGQQPLWSTIENNERGVRYVPLEKVTQEVLEFYDLYDRYYDLTGFSKERFIDEVGFGLEAQDLENLNDINELTVKAIKSNTGQGSFVLVACISEDNVDMIIFSNSGIPGLYNSESTYLTERAKFARWFSAIIHADSGGVEEDEKIGEQAVGTQSLYPRSSNLGNNENTSGDVSYPDGNVDSRALFGKKGGGGPSLDLAGWRWDYVPNPNNNTKENGRIVFEIRVDENGEAISVRTLEKTVSPDLEQLYRWEVEKLTFSSTSDNTIPAPISTGKITFIIQSK